MWGVLLGASDKTPISTANSLTAREQNAATLETCL